MLDRREARFDGGEPWLEMPRRHLLLQLQLAHPDLVAGAEIDDPDGKHREREEPERRLERLHDHAQRDRIHASLLSAGRVLTQETCDPGPATRVSPPAPTRPCSGSAGPSPL